jgi:hypothetical protein
MKTNELEYNNQMASNALLENLNSSLFLARQRKNLDLDSNVCTTRLPN